MQVAKDQAKKKNDSPEKIDYIKAERKEKEKPELTFGPTEEGDSTEKADVQASTSNLLPPSKRDVTIHEITSVRKSASKMSALSGQTKLTPHKGAETDLASQMGKMPIGSALKMNEATIYEVSSDDEPDDITGLNLKNYIIDKDFNGMMILLQDLAQNRRTNNPIE